MLKVLVVVGDVSKRNSSKVSKSFFLDLGSLNMVNGGDNRWIVRNNSLYDASNSRMIVWKITLEVLGCTCHFIVGLIMLANMGTKVKAMVTSISLYFHDVRFGILKDFIPLGTTNIVLEKI